MDAMMLLGEVERPVRVEVPVVLQGAEFQDSLGAVDAPPGAGDVETIADQVPACAFHHPCRDWPSRGQPQVVPLEFLLVPHLPHPAAHPPPPSLSPHVLSLLLPPS